MCGGSQLSGECLAPKGQPKCCSCGDDHMANYQNCVNWKEAKVALARQAPYETKRTPLQAAPKAEWARPAAE